MSTQTDDFKELDDGILKNFGLTTGSLDVALEVMDKINLISKEYSWPHVKHDNTDLFKIVRIKQLALVIEKNIRIIKKKEYGAERTQNKEMDTKLLDETGIRNSRKERESKYKRVYDKMQDTCEAKLKIEQEHDDNSTNTASSSSCVQHEGKDGDRDAKKRKLSATSRRCYICKASTKDLHHFYDQMCFDCGIFNFKKRNQTADLSGKVALITGGRVKIGFETALKLLRGGARVIITTRFPRDSLIRYQAEKDFNKWNKNLHIYGLDLRFINLVEDFCDHISKKYGRLDILIQNAAQTIRRPTIYYKHLIDKELDASGANNKILQSFPTISQNSYSPQLLLSLANPTLSASDKIDISVTAMASSSSTPLQSSNSIAVIASQISIHPEDRILQNNTRLFPPGQYDTDHQQLDLRPLNSWVAETDEVDTSELAEVHCINYISPYILLSKLTPLMKKTTSTYKCFAWVVMVSSMEGQFNRSKTTSSSYKFCKGCTKYDYKNECWLLL